MQRLMSVFLLAIAACGDAGSQSPHHLPDAAGNAQDAHASSDGASRPNGLELVWLDMPVLPGVVTLTPSVTVASVKFNVKKLEVLGDAGAVAETTAENQLLEWSATSAGPSPIQFELAPPAIYNKVRISIDVGANTPSVEILGTTNADGVNEQFRITSREKLDLEVTGYDVTLGVSDSQRIDVLVALDVGLQNLNWAGMRRANNTLVLEDTDLQAMDAFFADLAGVFTAPL